MLEAHKNGGHGANGAFAHPTNTASKKKAADAAASFFFRLAVMDREMHLPILAGKRGARLTGQTVRSAITLIVANGCEVPVSSRNGRRRLSPFARDIIGNNDQRARYNMLMRLIAAALCLGAMSSAALAQTPDFATLAPRLRHAGNSGAENHLALAVGDVSKANPWRNIIVHQTQGGAGSARYGAMQQAKNPTRRGVTVWVETDGTVYWAVPEDAIPTHGDGANRNDNKYIDNGATFRQVLKTNSIGVEFAGNFADV